MSSEEDAGGEKSGKVKLEGTFEGKLTGESGQGEPANGKPGADASKDDKSKQGDSKPGGDEFADSILRR